MTQHLTIIGLGLIGSSIARAVGQHAPEIQTTGYDANELSLAYATKHHIIHHAATSMAQAAHQADIVIIATPTPMLANICQAIAPHLKTGTLVMDTGSVKRSPLAIMQAHLPAHTRIVPAHPIAGSEQSGVAAGKADLFAGKRVIITPESPLDNATLQEINRFWEPLGARVEAMPAEMHDMIYGYVSHLPQLLAFAAAEVVQPSAKLTRFLRISQSDRALWNDIFAENQDVLASAVSRYVDAIVHIHKELKTAPQDTEVKPTNADVQSLFARIAASCLITTVMEAEKKAGVPFARFAGTGFADFTSPATSEPDQDLENISNHYAALIPMLADYIAALSSLVQNISSLPTDPV